LPAACVDRVVSNPPFGKQLSTPEEVGPLYRQVISELDRVLKPGGRAVLLVSEGRLLSELARSVGWKSVRALRLRILGQPASLSVWDKR
jgi:tRNA G10  N-methylase Trm11